MSTSPSTSVTILGLFRTSLGVYRRRFLRVGLTALAVFTPIGLIEVAMHDWNEHAHLAKDESALVLLLIVTPVVGFLSMFGEVFFAGLLDESIGADLSGHPLPSLREIIRKVPWGKLLVADVLVAFVTQIGTDTLLVPGMVLFTLFAIVGPVVNIEQLGPLAALKRSVKLVWPHFLTAAACVLVPTIILTFAGEWFVENAHHQPWPLVTVAAAFLSLTLAASVGVLEVVLAHTLIAEDRSRT